DWANAYAIAGGSLPVMLPFDVAISLSFNVGAPRSLRFLVNCDNYVREMQVREENPDAIGPLSISPEGKLPANSWQTLTQTYTVGDLPMRPGGSVLVGRQFMSNQGPLQRDDPAGDNYITIASSNSTAQFENTNHPFAGMHGGFRGAAGMMTFTLRGTTLGKGDTITVTYGDKSGGSRGFQVQTFANDFYPLPLYIDFDGKENFFTVPIKPFRVRGIGVHAVHGFAPSVVGVGEHFDVSVRSEDLYYNRAAGAIPAYEVQLNGESHSTIPAGRDAITVLEDLTFDSPGVYRFAFQSPDGKVTGEANPVWVREHPERRIYWGETHGHSGLAEGQGSPEFYFRFAREDAVLDFVTLSEHDLWMDNSEWELLRSAVTKYKKENEFIVYLGYEWTMTPSQGGHHNVFFRRPEGRKRVGVQR
ncbi:MAG: hypothetical protein QF662_08595, partial [Phycisphaerae bacterium]|nr:hypothetical protein [Phycisphaerae bacterium]